MTVSFSPLVQYNYVTIQGIVCYFMYMIRHINCILYYQCYYYWSIS